MRPTGFSDIAIQARLSSYINTCWPLSGETKITEDFSKVNDLLPALTGSEYEYFRSMRTTKSHLRYFDYCGNVLDDWRQTGGQQGDPLEMIVFCFNVHHLWGMTLHKHQGACAVAYADDGYIKVKLSVALEVLTDIKHVFKDDADFDLNFGKTKLLVKGISAADEHDASQRMLAADPSLAHLSPLLSLVYFVVDSYIGFGVPVGTHASIQQFVKDKCQAIMEDVDKLASIQDGFIHYKLIRFFQATLLQYLNGHVQFANQCMKTTTTRLPQDRQRPPEEGHPRRLQGVEPAGPRLG